MEKYDQENIATAPWYINHGQLVAIAAGLICLGLDFYFGNQIFQRFGAVVVGFALFHNVSLNNVKLLARQNELVKEAWRKHMIFPDDADDLRRNPQILEAAKRRFVETVILLPFFNTDEGLERQKNIDVLFQRIESHHYSYSKNISLMETIKRKELGLGIVGTLIWAFGDWISNWAFHCQQLSCGH